MTREELETIKEHADRWEAEGLSLPSDVVQRLIAALTEAQKEAAHWQREVDFWKAHAFEHLRDLNDLRRSVTGSDQE